MKLKRLFNHFVPEPTSLSLGEQLRSVAVTFLAILLLIVISRYSLHGESVPLLLASMGASAVILFAAYNSPLAQPWSFVVSHLLSAAIGITCTLWIDQLWLSAAIAVALSLLIMQRLHCLHPPGGATALVPILGGAEVHELGYQLLITPVLLNVMVLLGLAMLLNRGILRRKYPYRPKATHDNPHQLSDLRPLERVNVNQADVAEALKHFDRFLDISEDDLYQIYHRAEANAQQRRLGKVYCGDVMSRDLVTVTPDTPQQDAWSLLQKHKIKALPVVDEMRYVVGIVTLIDFLKPLGLKPTALKSYRGFQSRAAGFIRRLSVVAAQPETVRAIMSTNVLVARQDQHLMELMPTLRSTELHHIPVVDEQQKLVGILTSSDLLAALYAGQVPVVGPPLRAVG